MWTLPKRCLWQFLDVCLIALSVLVVYLGVRVATHSQNFIVWFYKSSPHWMRWLLDMIYLRSSWLQRIFSYRLKIKETVEACDDISGQSVAGDLARSVGLSFETHHVRTKDDCNLILHRCFLPPHRKKRDINRGRGVRTAEAQCPVLLGHGLMQNSESFLCGGETSLACVLARAGHDVWLANNRGNKYSSVDLQDDSIRFWDFSIDELAMYDFPANVEFVTEYTGSKSLVYIGFSQGTTQAFASLSSASTKLSAKISLFIAIAPAVFPCGFRDSLVSKFFSSPFSGYVTSTVFGSGAMLHLTQVSQQIFSKSFFACAVRFSLHYLFSCQSNNISHERQVELFQHVYSPSSVKCVKHWLQIIQSGSLSKYDHGQSYQIPQITVPVAVIFGSTDALVEAKSLVNHLGNCVMHKEISQFEHLELIWADKAHVEVFPTVLELLDENVDFKK